MGIVYFNLSICNFNCFDEIVNHFYDYASGSNSLIQNFTKLEA